MTRMLNPVPNSSYISTLEMIGKKLTELRLQKGFKNQLDFTSQYDLPHIQYWRMERGAANLTLKSLHRVLSIHGLTIEELFLNIHSKNDKR
jgi:hypothetical protein